MAAEENVHEFKVAIRGIALDADTKAEINSAVQRVVLDRLASLDNASLAVHWPREWLGIWVEDINGVIERGKLSFSE